MREQPCSCLKEVWPELDIVAEGKNGFGGRGADPSSKPGHGVPRHPHAGLTGVEAAKQIAQMPEDDER